MNKPVFDKVTGKAVNVGSPLDETLAGDRGRVGAAMPALDFLADELDGRRSVVAETAPAASSSTGTLPNHKASSAISSLEADASSSSEGDNGGILAAADDIFPVSFDIASSQSAF